MSFDFAILFAHKLCICKNSSIYGTLLCLFWLKEDSGAEKLLLAKLKEFRPQSYLVVSRAINII